MKLINILSPKKIRLQVVQNGLLGIRENVWSTHTDWLLARLWDERFKRGSKTIYAGGRIDDAIRVLEKGLVATFGSIEAACEHPEAWTALTLEVESEDYEILKGAVEEPSGGYDAFVMMQQRAFMTAVLEAKDKTATN